MEFKIVENCAGLLHYYYILNDSNIIQKIPSKMLFNKKVVQSLEQIE